MTVPLEVAGSVAVVTGGANGIGKGIVRALLEADASVVIADIEQDVMDTTVAVLSASLAVGRRPATVLRLLVVYPTLHLSWGVGFLAGPPPGVSQRAAGQDAS